MESGVMRMVLRSGCQIWLPPGRARAESRRTSQGGKPTDEPGRKADGRPRVESDVANPPARHPPCVDGSPVWPPDHDVHSISLHATELASVVASFRSASCPAARFASTWTSQDGKRRDENGAAVWLPDLASTWASQGGKPTDEPRWKNQKNFEPHCVRCFSTASCPRLRTRSNSLVRPLVPVRTR